MSIDLKFTITIRSEKYVKSKLDTYHTAHDEAIKKDASARPFSTGGVTVYTMICRFQQHFYLCIL